VNIKVAVLDDHEFICRAISALGRDYPELAGVAAWPRAARWGGPWGRPLMP